MSRLFNFYVDHEPEKLEPSPEKPKLPPKRRRPKPKTPGNFKSLSTRNGSTSNVTSSVLGIFAINT